MRSAGFRRAGWLVSNWAAVPTIFCGNLVWATRMSALGQKQTCAAHKLMSALCQ